MRRRKGKLVFLSASRRHAGADTGTIDLTQLYHHFVCRDGHAGGQVYLGHVDVDAGINAKRQS